MLPVGKLKIAPLNANLIFIALMTADVIVHSQCWCVCLKDKTIPEVLQVRKENNKIFHSFQNETFPWCHNACN